VSPSPATPAEQTYSTTCAAFIRFPGGRLAPIPKGTPDTMSNIHPDHADGQVQAPVAIPLTNAPGECALLDASDWAAWQAARKPATLYLNRSGARAYVAYSDALEPGPLKSALRVAGLKGHYVEGVVQHAHDKTPKLSIMQKNAQALQNSVPMRIDGPGL